MDEWRQQYPSVVVTRTYQGDLDYALRFFGDGNNLLYQLKNLMKLGNLMQLQMRRALSDGTVITVWSIHGQNFVDIDVRQSTLGSGRQSCAITFIDFPLAVPPMKNPREIEDGEVEGVEYFKSYYIADIKNCPTCQEIAWEFLFTYSDPFEPRHFDDEVDNHTVYSLSPPATGEIISHGSDSLGDYIIWKAYTESGDGVTYSRTGLGIMLLKASISDTGDKVVCSQQTMVDVDCCEKDSDLRNVEIWWEDHGNCQPFIPYQGTLYNAICKAPPSLAYLGGVASLFFYACENPYQPFYSIPEIKGECLPVEWTLSGPVEFFNGPGDKNENTIFIRCLSTDCHAVVSITLRDRCGKIYTIDGTSCCENAGPLQIGPSSIAVGFGGIQQFSSSGGCAPLLWSCITGTITQDGEYHAPASYPGSCTASVSVSDCCGNESSASVQLIGGGGSWQYGERVVCYNTGPPLNIDIGHYTIHHMDCEGNETSSDCAYYYGGAEWHYCEEDGGGHECDHYLPVYDFGIAPPPGCCPP